MMLAFATSLRAVLPLTRMATFDLLETLIAMKVTAGRPRDLDDIQHLQWIQQDQSNDD